MIKKSADVYRIMVQRRAQQLRKVARGFRDPKLRDRIERLALDIVGKAEQPKRQNNPKLATRH
jgi:hypothetical protein